MVCLEFNRYRCNNVISTDSFDNYWRSVMNIKIRKLTNIVLATAAVFIVASCVTINIYFPAAAVEKVADEIVEEVWGRGSGVPEADEGKDAPGEGVTPQSRFKGTKVFSFIKFGVPEAVAADADINVSTPAIRKIKKSIQERAPQVIPYLDKGAVGISKDGFLVERPAEGLGLKDKAAIRRLLSQENKDRAALYGEITAANNFEPSRVADIRDLFARSWIKNASSGWWVESPEGEWVKK